MRQLIALVCICTVISCGTKETSETDNTSIPKEIIADNIELAEKKHQLTIRERIDGPANIRDTINGKILFELFDNTLLEVAPQENDWFNIGLYVQVSEEQAETLKILPNQELIFEEKVVGKTKDTVALMILVDEDIALINGLTHKKNIKENTIPERVFSELITTQNFDKVYFDEFLKNFQFELFDSAEQFSDINQYLIYESIMVDMSPRDRMTLLFQNDKLIGLIHSREIQSHDFNTVELIRGHKLSTVNDISKELVALIKKEKIYFYNNVD